MGKNVNDKKKKKRVTAFLKANHMQNHWETWIRFYFKNVFQDLEVSMLSVIGNVSSVLCWFS
jgi:hypothetical protein